MTAKTRLLTSSKLYRHPNTVVALGDSRVAQIHADGAYRNKSANNHFGVGNALAGQRAILLKNLGNSGDRTDQALVRLQAAIDSGAYVLYVHLGVNDIAQAYPTATTSGITAWANIKTMIDAGIANGMLPLVVLDPGANNFSAAQITQLIILNENIREYAEKVRMVLFDLAAAIYNPVATSTTAIAILGSIDGVHEANLGGYLGVKAFAQVLTAIMPPRTHGVRGAFEVPSNSLINLLTNPMFTGGTAGAVGAGLTGQIGTGWVGSRAGGATATASVADATDGSGLKEQVLACTFTALNDEVNVHQDVAIANWSPGDILQASAEVVVDNASSNLAGVYLYLQANGTGNGFGAVTAMDGYCQGTGWGAGPTEGRKYLFETEKLIVPNYTTKSWVTAHAKAIGAGAGSATMRVRRFQVRKLLA